MNKYVKFTLIGLGITGAVGVSVYAYRRYKNREEPKEEGILSASEAQAMYRQKREALDKKMAEKNDIPKDFDPAINADEDGIPEQTWGAKDMDDKIADLKMWSLEKEKKAQEENLKAPPSEVLAMTMAELEEEERENAEAEREMNEQLAAEEALEMQEPIILEDEGVGTLRHDPNSDAALEQYMKMELAEWAPHEDEYKTLLKMFEVPFDPIVDGDIDLKGTLADYRAEFFGGDSQWIERISYADLILHFGRRSDFSFGQGIRHWIRTLLYINGLDPHVTEQEMYVQLRGYSEHGYSDEDGSPDAGNSKKGIFQLPWRGISGALQYAQQKIDNEVTFQLEFEEWKKLVQSDQVDEQYE